LFSDESKNNIHKLPELTSEQVNKFVSGIDLDKETPAESIAVDKKKATATRVSEMELNELDEALVSHDDKIAATIIIDGLIERAAKLVAANLASVILRTGKAKSEDKPVLMTIEGTTFYKLKKFQSMFESFLQQFLSGDKKRHYEIVEVENSSLLGAAIAAIVN